MNRWKHYQAFRTLLFGSSLCLILYVFVVICWSLRLGYLRTGELDLYIHLQRCVQCSILIFNCMLVKHFRFSISFSMDDYGQFCDSTLYRGYMANRIYRGYIHPTKVIMLYGKRPLTAAMMSKIYSREDCFGDE